MTLKKKLVLFKKIYISLIIQITQMDFE